MNDGAADARSDGREKLNMPMIGIWEILILFALVLLIGVFMMRNRTEIPPKTPAGNPRRVRITQRRTIGGVCAGFAYKFGVPAWLARVIMVLLRQFQIL